jgi:tellurite resistance protein TehA-like permease
MQNFVRLFDQDSARCSMKYRVAMWAAAGFLVASGWAVYYLVRNKDLPIEPMVSTLVRLTCPIAIVGAHYPVSLYSALAANVATYALVGLVVETLRRQLNHSN